ncbi:MAG TPA: DUF2095 domain-containing protein [Candidatus Caldiarchaeum subterraneum]|uniref:DUF2095 domain-containing protein n=1 Tax=Caldiarchaeum subterraneum TaxID=311458 RepID=A0A832ZWP2_CALS0|nr:DUF2095 domain-containing protein [Candidatus Caldarchaeum subterraneum]
MPEYRWEEFRRLFPNLAREIEAKSMSLKIDSIRSSPEYAERDASIKMPTVVDYLRRCDTDEEAREVINFLREHGEITGEEADKLLKQLEEQGVRSFGSRKTPGHYLRRSP